VCVYYNTVFTSFCFVVENLCRVVAYLVSLKCTKKTILVRRRGDWASPFGLLPKALYGILSVFARRIATREERVCVVVVVLILMLILRLLLAVFVL